MWPANDNCYFSRLFLNNLDLLHCFINYRVGLSISAKMVPGYFLRFSFLSLVLSNVIKIIVRNKGTPKPGVMTEHKGYLRARQISLLPQEGVHTIGSGKMCTLSRLSAQGFMSDACDLSLTLELRLMVLINWLI